MSLVPKFLNTAAGLQVEVGIFFNLLTPDPILNTPLVTDRLLHCWPVSNFSEAVCLCTYFLWGIQA